MLSVPPQRDSTETHIKLTVRSSTASPTGPLPVKSQSSQPLRADPCMCSASPLPQQKLPERHTALRPCGGGVQRTASVWVEVWVEVCRGRPHRLFPAGWRCSRKGFQDLQPVFMLNPLLLKLVCLQSMKPGDALILYLVKVVLFTSEVGIWEWREYERQRETEADACTRTHIPTYS